MQRPGMSRIKRSYLIHSGPCELREASLLRGRMVLITKSGRIIKIVIIILLAVGEPVTCANAQSVRCKDAIHVNLQKKERRKGIK